ncbi:MAG: GNAT family N-acetyltransferase, partial [Streptosporangiaceae bacterium]
PLAGITPDELEIKRIYLLHRFQGGGLGARLMNTARDHARARGCRRLLLGVYGGNTAAIGFYERLGYQRAGQRVFQVGQSTYDDEILALHLAE